MEKAIVEAAPSNHNSVISKHVLRREHRTVYSLVAVTGLFTAFLSAAIGVYRWYFAYRHFGPAAVPRWSAPAIGLSLGSALLGIIGLACLLHLNGSFAKVYSGGILIGRRGKVEKIPWDQIQAISTSSVRYGLPWFTWGSSAKVSLHLRSKGKRTLSQSLSNLEQLASTTKEYIYPGLLNEYRHTLQQGEAVQFGSIEIARRELVHRKRRYAWSEIDKVSLDRGFLRIQTHSSRRKRCIRLPARRIPNIDLCYQLMQHFVTEESKKHRGIKNNSKQKAYV